MRFKPDGFSIVVQKGIQEVLEGPYPDVGMTREGGWGAPEFMYSSSDSPVLVTVTQRGLAETLQCPPRGCVIYKFERL